MKFVSRLDWKSEIHRTALDGSLRKCFTPVPVPARRTTLTAPEAVCRRLLVPLLSTPARDPSAAVRLTLLF